MSGLPLSLSSKFAKALPAHIPNPVLQKRRINTHSPKKRVTFNGKPAKMQIGSQIAIKPGIVIASTGGSIRGNSSVGKCTRQSRKGSQPI